MCPDLRAEPGQSLENTAVQKGLERVRVPKKGGRVRGGACCRGKVFKMKRKERGRTGKRENSQMPGFIHQKQHKQNTHKPA